MRTMTLSDHPGDLLDQIGPDRAVRGRWWTWLRAALMPRRKARRGPASDSAQVEDRRERIRAGRAGEQSVADRLGRVLGDEWLLFRGYCNRRGEIDLLLLGPPGLVAIEVKNLNATVSCDGDRWSFVKFDRYGNAVNRGVIEDARGRSPSRQVNDSASALADFLVTRGYSVAIERVVLLTHERAELGRCASPTVRIATSADGVVKLARSRRPALTARDLTQLERLVVGDHRYNERRRRR
jgi:nuclease-like protein